MWEAVLTPDFGSNCTRPPPPAPPAAYSIPAWYFGVGAAAAAVMLIAAAVAFARRRPARADSDCPSGEVGYIQVDTSVSTSRFWRRMRGDARRAEIEPYAG